MQFLDSVNTIFNTKVTKDKQLPQFKAGDKVVVKSRIKEGDKERVQAFEGVVIARKGRGASSTFIVRKVSGGVGVERIYPLYSPNIVSIERKVEGFVRRAKLYYIRDLDGKAARIKDKNIRLMETQGVASSVVAAAAAKHAEEMAHAAELVAGVHTDEVAPAYVKTEKPKADKAKKPTKK
jgi:large subunit ribosomal protein L19